jgi:hypothetical protein
MGNNVPFEIAEEGNTFLAMSYEDFSPGVNFKIHTQDSLNLL